ncbi:Phosphate transport system permease protein pstC [Rickettsiales bacterium Ac37b]|nr:Phosphate transport system permease protein pstC [Rickettsiales bacterium Ac37b]
MIKLIKEKIIKVILFVATLLSVIVTIAVIGAVFMESVQFFTYVSPLKFLFGTYWNPQLESDDSFGIIPLLLGTLLITVIAILVAVPIGLLSAIYLSEYANSSVRNIVKPVLEILAGIPTVVYGYFAALIVSPFIRNMASLLGARTISSESALAAGLVMGIMIIPFMLSISEDIISKVPRSLRDASLALGATKSETILRVVIPAALPGVMSAILLSMSRAVGETMIVTMASGLNANLTFNPLASVTTVTAQIVALLVGDQEFNSPRTLSAFALALALIVITLFINMLALFIVKKYQERYE